MDSKAKKQIKIFIAGDSTASTYSENNAPRAGWGQLLHRFFNQEVKVINKAASGRSSRSFIAENRLAEIEKLISKDDYLMIQFGHNDQKDDPARKTDAAEDFPDYLTEYIKTARQNKAVPILLTPIARRNFSADGKLIATHGKYPAAIRQLAEQEQVALLDLTAISHNYFEKLGPEKTKDIFLWLAAGESENYPAGETDNTHFSATGALMIAALIVNEIKKQKLDLAKYILKGVELKSEV
ncbi:rhamnogalacturonan acetylesterase [Halanaerobium salsuginis]|jgi:lysophospholipase L1-like esterase|uniref:Lysophospholipase L1 n=1 Tax=Halanaerobium salsuginis TaxID=29563 RepID=A0A1I4HW45_9FIRM|nr:rhamnogalacturonan acetylesterase [Halanaerobium salsuginis]SFL45957.1 Lysophospholipase L1 [Halanaerobium salsuginis]